MSTKTVRLITTVRHCYQGRWLAEGEEFEATEEDADDLCCSVINKAKRSETLSLPKRNAYARRDLKAEE